MNIVRRSTAAVLAALLASSVAGAATAEARSGWRIERDSYGVPRVYADTAPALFYGDGYAQAQERLWQADLVRRTASGYLSALIGPGAGNANVQSDEYFRLYTGGYAALHRQVLALDRRTRTALDAFVAGYNAWITQATAQGLLPLEYAGVHQQPQPWTDEDVLATGMISVLQVGTTGADELTDAAELADLDARLGPAAAAAAFGDSHWTDDPGSPTTIPWAAGRVDHRASILPTPAGAEPAAADEAVARQRAAHRAMARLGLDSVGHSNAIALSGRLTASGHPLLLGGPQIGYSLPQGFVEIGLHGAGYDVTGVVLAGTPGVEIGVGHNFAWTVTTGGDDNQDWYAERLDPAAHPGRYFYRGAWRPFDCRVETIEVAGSAPVAQTACESVHGPVLGQQGNFALTLKDATRGRIDVTLAGFLGIDRARSLQEFLRAGRSIRASLNLTYASTSGHIAYAHVGPVPIRAVGDNPFLPHPGDGSDEWRGLRPTDAMPLVIDPVRGWLANWNNKPQQHWANSSDGFWQWGPVQRVQVIQRQVARIAPHTATTATLEAINRTTGETAETPVGVEPADVVQVLRPQLLAALGGASSPVVQLLRNWDESRVDANHDGAYDSPALTIFNAWYAALVDTTVRPALGDNYAADGNELNTTANIVSRLLSGRHASLPLRYDYLQRRSLSSVVAGALQHAVDDLTARFGTADVDRWLTPDVSITWSPLGAGSVPTTPWMNRGTYNQIVSLVPGRVTGENVVAPGESGDVRSPHFADQLQLYATWHYKPMTLR
ncbi:MAG TPA: penicillin acylase family protein [Jatrophihabitans sp.]|jgi:penicillin amidase|uniref:penicillin acylase family protein n=1 Tax=Jatrophihabitans sp. TaxID=1932789 RepID=UPI002E05AED2|nr:penicillin acylase family protein [Jatrophihabitans sp.]